MILPASHFREDRHNPETAHFRAFGRLREFGSLFATLPRSARAGAYAHEMSNAHPPIFPYDTDDVEMPDYNPPNDPPNTLFENDQTSQPPIGPIGASLTGAFWTFDMVEERLVEAVHLWRRSPGGGRSPFATDGPWQLVKAEFYGPDVDKDAPIRPLPLRRREVAKRDEVSAWLLFVPERDRRLVVLAVTALASGFGQVPWMRLRKPMSVTLGADGLRMRYGRAIHTICKRLNGGKAWVNASTP
jgi:hypothetical protein